MQKIFARLNVMKCAIILIVMLMPDLVVAGESSINGEATYLERIALPPHAVFKATLEDVSLMDVPSVTIGSIIVSPAGQVPITFKIKYDPDKIQKGHLYSVRGRITLDDKLLYITDTSNPVLDGTENGYLQLVLKQVKRSTVNGQSADKQLTDNIFSQFPVHFPGHFPAHFIGLLPGANCESQYQLDLFSDHTFFIRNRCSKNGKNVESDDIGRWHIDAGKKQLVLHGGREQPILFSILDTNTIEKLDTSGKLIESELNYKLKSARAALTLEPKIFMQGMYQYMADAALFKECITGLKLPVLFEKDSLALEQAYNRDKNEAGALLKVHIEGRIVQRPKMEGDGMQAHLLVERFIKTMPSEHCGNQYVDASFSNTYWKLTALNGEPIKTRSKNREAHIVFRSHQNKYGEYRGATGCDALFGNYQIEDKRVRVNYNQATMAGRHCLDSDIEQSFLLALNDAAYWRIKGDHMELLNSASQVLARFEAIYF